VSDDKPTGTLTDEEWQRFRDKFSVGDPDTCWPWKAGHFTDGAGNFYLRKKYMRAPRVAYELSNGPVKGGLHVLHHCDNPGCVNPRHLYLGTNYDNIRDRNSRNRQAKGEGNGRAKLTANNVAAMRIAHKNGASYRYLAYFYGVSPTTIQQAVRGKTWR